MVFNDGLLLKLWPLRLDDDYTSGWNAVMKWGLRDGLNLCYEMQLSVVDVQLDAKAVVQLLANSLSANICALPLLDDCRQLISQIGQVRISHYFYEANTCADFLAWLGSQQESSFVLFHDPPVGLLDLLSSDRAGLFHSRYSSNLPCSPQFFSLMKFPSTKKKKKTKIVTIAIPTVVGLKFLK